MPCLGVNRLQISLELIHKSNSNKHLRYVTDVGWAETRAQRTAE
jgi:hypothetical protein